MANTKKNPDLVDRLHAGGIRKRTAQLISDATDGRKKPAKQVRAALKSLDKALSDVQDVAKGGPEKRKLAGKKAAATRKKNAAQRSASAKKGAATKKANA